MPIYADTSILNELAKCEKAAYLRYVLHKSRRGSEEAPLVCGTALHKVEEGRQKGATVEEGLATLEREYRAWAEARVPGDDPRGWANVREIVEIWLTNHPIDRQMDETVEGSVERGMAAALDDHGDYVLVGRLDKLTRDRQYGGLMVDDFKHTSANLNGKNRDNWLSWYEMAAQGPNYCLMVEQTWQEPVIGMRWSVLSLAPLPNSSSKCKTHQLKYSECRKAHLGWIQAGPRIYGEQEKANVRQATLYLARRWAQLQTMEAAEVQETGRYSGACERCQFKAFCQAGSPWDMLEAGDYVTEKWEPYEHAFGGPTQIEVAPKRELPMVEGPSLD